MNFKEEFLKGQKGQNKGIHISYSPGLEKISKVINGVQKRRIFTVAAGPKVGKTTFTDAFFLIGMYLKYLEEPFPLEFIYFSFEITRIEKEFEIATFFLNYDYGIENVNLVSNQTKDKKKVISLSPDYLMGRLVDDDGEVILAEKSLIEKIKQVYINRIIPLFGEYNEQGIQIQKGLITFITEKDNPTGLWRYLCEHASNNGTFSKNLNNKFNGRSTIYKENDEKKYTIVITDHVRKLKLERNFFLKQTVDKYSEYCCEIRDSCNYTFVHVVHTNRDFTSNENLKYYKDNLYPTSDSLKDTGNLSEDSNYIFTMMNPNDGKYNLKKHFGRTLKDDAGNLIYPNIRTLHLVESRHCYFPQHWALSMNGNLKKFDNL